MKAIICTEYGSPDVLHVKEIDKPTPKDNEVLINIVASSVTAADGMMRKGSPYFGRLFIGLTKPKYPISGTGLAGVVEATGKDVTRFNIGDEVFGESVFGSGTNAEFVCLEEDGMLAIKPDNLSFEEAAPICDGAVTSLNFLRDQANIQPGQKVLINAASGSLGTAAVQIAKYYGAEVTAVCSTENIAMVKSIGADHVIDYTQTDFTDLSRSSKKFDIIFDTIGKRSFTECKPVLVDNGLYLSPVLGMALLFDVLWTSLRKGKKAKFSATGVRPVVELRELLDQIKSIVEAGKMTSIIDRHYSLEHVVDAHRYVETGHKKGNVVLAN